MAVFLVILPLANNFTQIIVITAIQLGLFIFCFAKHVPSNMLAVPPLHFVNGLIIISSSLVGFGKGERGIPGEYMFISSPTAMRA